jgi:cytochrome c-type biogenesis protein
MDRRSTESAEGEEAVSELPGFLVAFAGGLISFLSPCTLPLLPGYLSYVSGLSAEEVQERENRVRVVSAAGLFVLGFSLIFVALGATTSYIGEAVIAHQSTLTRIAGIFIIFMALIMIGLVRLPVFYQEKRFHISAELGMWGAFPLGMAFAFGWSPCIGPILTSILVLATKEGTAQQGALLLFVYSLGLGVPFLLVALFAERLFQSLGWFKRHYQAFNTSGGAILLVMGVFLVLDRWTQLLGPMMRWYANLNLPT